VHPEIKKDEKMPTSSILAQISKMYDENELKAIANGGRLVPGQCKVPSVHFEGHHIKFGFMTDTHYGSLYSPEEWVEAAIKQFKKSKVDFIVHAGDVTEGMSARPGHVYELKHIGYSAQKQAAIEGLSDWEGQWYMIGGNHDGWYMQNSNNGADIVEDICKALPKAQYLGSGEGMISLKGRATMMPWHGLDAGGSYALSYRVQKIIEAFPIGEKPSILLTGHDHKSLAIPSLRGIHAISGGCMQRQTAWMRQTRKAAMCGFWEVDVWVDERGVSKIGYMFYPFYA
jgi:predicted phosphodiesterase